MLNKANCKKIIPGIELVSDLALNDFFKIDENKKLEKLLTNFEHVRPIWPADTLVLRKFQTNANIQSTLTSVEKEPSLDNLKKLIYKAMLKKQISTFVFIDSAAQAILTNKPYTVALYNACFVTKSPEKQCVADWESAFNSDAEISVVNIREQIEVRKLEFINHTKHNIGFFFYSADYTDRELNALFYDIGVQLYYSDTNQSPKKERLTEAFKKYLKQYESHKQQATFDFPDLKTGFSYLFSRIMQQKDVKRTQETIDRIANVHLLFGILGLREPAGWMLENIDIYNYVALADDVSTLKTVLFAFAKPLRSFFVEYVQIAKLEKNPLLFLFRATIPILIMTCFVAFAFSLMVPFAMHAIIEIIMLMPTLYTSMLLASSYVDLKNRVFETFIVYSRGSRYEQDAFQTNDRILAGFDNNQIVAEDVRCYYVKCFENCDAKVRSLSKQFERGLLGDDEIDDYEAMLNREALLKMEWYDIHDNNSLGVCNLKPLVAKRLQQDAADAYQTLQTVGTVYIESLITALEQHLVLCENTENATDPETRQAFCAHMRWSMFKPTKSVADLTKKYVSQQETLELIDKMPPRITSRPTMLPV